MTVLEEHVENREDIDSDTFNAKLTTWVTGKRSLGYFLEALATTEEVVVDLETTGLDDHAIRGGATNGGVPAEIVLASFTLPQPDDSGEPTTWLLPLAHPESPLLGSWRKVLRLVAARMKERPIVNHNVKFDMRWIKSLTGVNLAPYITWDSMLAAHLLDENRSRKLKERVPWRFGVTRWDDFDLTYPGAARDVPLLDLGLYAARDTYWTWKLSVWQRDQMFVPQPGWDEPLPPVGPEEVQNARLGQVARYVAVPTSRVLTTIEQRGLSVDLQWIAEHLDQEVANVTELTEHLAKLYPDAHPDRTEREVSFAPTSLYFADWTAQAIKAGDLRVEEMTPTGKPRWSKEVLHRIAREAGEGSVADSLLQLRGSVKRAEYLTSWLKLASPQSKVHATYNVGSVVTGRLSSNSPNLQQVTKALKPAFIPRPGRVLAEIDYSQIELRVAAYVSRCAPMIEAYQQGRDLHRIMAGSIVHKAPDEVTKDERQAGKAGNFGFLYGMGAEGFQSYALSTYGVAFTPEEAQHVREQFFVTWDGISQWHAKVISHVGRWGEITSPIGRVRRVPEVWDGNEYLASRAERAAINSPVQGFASDLMQSAAASIEGLLPGRSRIPHARIVGTVHDSIMVEVPADGWEEVTRACLERMTCIGDDLYRLFKVTLDVPMAAEAAVGTRWGLSDVGVIED